MRAEDFQLGVDDWNAWMAFLQRNQLVVHGETGAVPAHPWKTRVWWSSFRKMWMAQIHPGFVNGLDAQTVIPAKWVPDATRARLGSVTNAAMVWLTENPEIEFSGWRTVPASRAPQWFRANFPLREPARLEIAAGGEGVTQELTDMPAGVRNLRACEIVLSQLRAASALEIDTATGRVAIVTRPQVSTRAVISTAPNFVPAVEPDALSFLQGALPLGKDELNLATVFLLSPPDAEEGAKPDDSWTPYVQHHVFGNLAHGTTPPREVRDLQLPRLGGGTIGRGLINQVVEETEVLATFASVLNATRIQGRFWSV